MQPIYEDSDLLVINKPSGMAIQADAHGTVSVLENLSQSQPIHLVHRLDQRVSGLVVFAKNQSSLVKLNTDFQQRNIQKFYQAIVSNRPPQESATLVHWLMKDHQKNLSKAYPKEIKHSKKAELNYRLLRSSEKYHLLEIELLTGRFHQIRCQLSAMGCPIVGDLKYGFKRSSPDGSIFLHATRLSFNHPITNERLTFELELPELWKKYGF